MAGWWAEGWIVNGMGIVDGWMDVNKYGLVDGRMVGWMDE